MIIIITTAVLSGSLLTAFISEISDETDEELESFEENFSEFHRQATIQEDQNPDEQIMDLAWFTTLRAEHCFALMHYILQEPLVVMDESEAEETIEEHAEEIEDGESPDIREFQTFSDMDYADARRLSCEAEEQQLNFEQLVHDVEEVSERLQNPLNELIIRPTMNLLSSIGSSIVNAPGNIYCYARDALNWATRGYVDDCPDDFLYLSSIWEEHDAMDMEGAFGNVNFDYNGTEPAFIDVPNGRPVKAHGLPHAPGHLMEDEEMDINDPDEIDHYYWGKENIYVAPDVRLAYYNVRGDEYIDEDVDLNDIRGSCEYYPIAEYVPYVQNAPVILERGESLEPNQGSSADFFGVNEPNRVSGYDEVLIRSGPNYFNLDGKGDTVTTTQGTEIEHLGSELDVDGEIYAISQGKAISGGMIDSAVPSVSDENKAENCPSPYGSVNPSSTFDNESDYQRDEKMDSGVAMDWAEDGWSETGNYEGIEYTIAFCPGTSGRIQANKGFPGNTQESTEFRYGFEFHHLVFPFIEIEPLGAHDCMEQFKYSESQENWVPNSGIPSDMSCETGEDLGSVDDEDDPEWICGVTSHIPDDTGSNDQLEVTYYKYQMFTRG